VDTEEYKRLQPVPNTSKLSTSPNYEAIAKNLPVGFSMVDKDGLIVDFNPAAEILTGYLKKELLGRPHLEILHGSSDPKSCPLLTLAFEKRTASIATEAVLKKKDGESIILSFTVFPLFDDSGQFIGGVELFRDITEVKRLERERKNFLSMFVHDMKNPITVFGGYLSRLLTGKAGPLTEKQKGYLTIILEQTQKLQRLIADFLEFSKFERKEFIPVLGSYNLEEAFSKQLEIMKVAAEKKNIGLIFNYTQEGLPIINADAALIDRLLTNLIDNAIKYTNPGGTVTIKLENREQDVLVEVADTGMGIDEKDLPCVFDAFCRINRNGEGSGLGLSIAKAIVSAHGGMISVDSTPGKGSTFRFTLPKKISPGLR
jgi:PAS domain S-box-containing protein